MALGEVRKLDLNISQGPVDPEKAALARQALARMGFGSWAGAAPSGNISSATNGPINSSVVQEHGDGYVSIQPYQNNGGSQSKAPSKKVWIISGVVLVVIVSIIMVVKS